MQCIACEHPNTEDARFCGACGGSMSRRGDADVMTRDLPQAQRLFAQLDVTGWDDYARSIET
jgi:hypothetical protein